MPLCRHGDDSHTSKSENEINERTILIVTFSAFSHGKTDGALCLPKCLPEIDQSQPRKGARSRLIATGVTD
jgi:hypothetical protein